MRRTALIVGGTGVAGRALLSHLTSIQEWDVIGVSRRRPDFDTRASWIEADLLDERSTREQLGALKQVTHLFYAGYVDAPTFAEQRTPNTAMLVNAVEALACANGSLEHVCLLQGTKYYGSHLGPFRTPARENDQRPVTPNFYYDQQDHLARRGSQLGFTYSCARPHVICGFADWRFANYVWSNDWDVMSSTLKCRQAGFLEFVDSEEMFLRVLGEFRARKVIP